jgi:ribonucleoside-diphosphate reductase alpha chain
MMAAVQPFLSGAISKTVNMPKEATIEEIEQTYIDAWKLGLKAVAIYRDKSKRSQPLNFSEKEDLEEMVAKPVRRKLPNTRNARVHKFDVAGHEGYLTVGMYDDGTPGEVFIDMSKEGSTTKGLMDAIGILTSMSLQYGVPLQKIVEKFRHQKFEPYGLARGHKEIHTADSTIDYIANFLGKEFLGNGDDENGNNNEKSVEIKVEDKSQKKTETFEEAGGFCAQCGARMIKKGHCREVCSKCGWESPKGCGE